MTLIEQLRSKKKLSPSKSWLNCCALLPGPYTKKWRMITSHFFACEHPSALIRTR